MGAGGSKEEIGGLTTSELQQIPENIRPKIEKHFLDQKESIEDLEGKYERLRVDSEQRYFELERNLIDVQGKLTAESALSSQLKDQLSDTEKKYNGTAQKFRDLQEKDFNFSRQMDELLRTKNQLEGEKHDLVELLEKKTREIDKLSDEWKNMSQRVNEANKSKINAIAKKDEFQSETVSLQHQVSRLNQEKTQVSDEKLWLEKVLKEKTDELLSFRKENSMKTLAVQSELEEKVDELKHEHDLHESQKERNERLQGQIENYIQKLKDQKELQAQSEEQYRNEIQAQEKLIHLYKSSSDEADNHVKELTTAVEELQNMLKQATTATSELENLRKQDAVRYEEMLQTNEKRINSTERELKDANELLETARKKGVAMLSDENLEILSPSAAAASRLLKSGMTLTQIYSEYVQATENLHLEKEENKRLNQYLDQILQEIEEKAPRIKKQRDDYERLLETVDQMTRQLDGAMLESERLRVQAEETGRRYNEVNRESGRLKQQSQDLSNQVRMLLKELSEARGTMVHIDELDVSRASSTSDAQRVVSDNLVTFKSIEELQEQNQKLLGVVRELTDRHQEEEAMALDSRTVKLNERLEQAAQEIDELKAARDRQEKLVESIVRQRDMYRVLLSQNSDAQLPMMAPSDTSTPSRPMPLTPKTPTGTPKSHGIQSALLEDTRKALKELQEEFTMYRQEKGKNEKLLNSQLDKFRSESSELKMQNAKLASQLDYSAERYKVLQSNIEGYKKEISVLTDKNSKYTTNIVKHEQKVATLREELMTLQGNLTKAEVQVQHLRSQNETLRSIEARLIQEKESSMRENRTSQLLMANLQAIQNNLERSEFETKTTLNNRIEALERENAQLKRKLDGAHDHQRNVIQSLEKQLTQARELLGQEDQSHRETMNLSKQQKIEIDSLTSQLKQLKEQHESAQKRLVEIGKAEVHKTVVPPASPEVQREEIRDLNNKINTANQEIQGLKEQLVKARQHAEQYKTIADSLEKNMAQQNKTTQEFKEKMEKEMQLAQKASEESKKLLNEVEKEKKKILEENIKLSNDISNSSEDLRSRLCNLQVELEQAVKLREASISNEQAARKDMEQQATRAREAQDKYERELILHAADVEALSQVKVELEGFHSKLRTAEESAVQAKEKLAFEMHSWSEREQLLKDDRKKLQDRIDEILDQNSVLHDQLEQLSNQMVNLQQRKEKDDKDTEEMAERFARDPGEKSPEQLIEVIKFLRKEKEIAEAKLEVIQAESTRMKQQSEYLKKQVDDANKLIEEERQRAQVSVQTAAQHADLLRKVENMNLLQDSNRHLREEKDRLNQQLKELEARSKKLESDIDPLQTKVREIAVERDTLQAETIAQKSEIESWKSRANHLIEQCNKFDPEEFKQAVKERDDLKKVNNTQKDENNKLKVEAVNIKMQLAHAKNEESAAKVKVEELNAEKAKLIESVQLKEKDIDEKTKSMAQLRTIGRKYRKQAEDANKEMEKVKQSQQQQVNVQDLQQKLKTAEDNVKSSEEKIKVLDKSVDDKTKSLEGQIKVAEEKIKVKETEMQGFEEKLKTTEECLKTSEVKRKALEERCRSSEEKQKLMETAQKTADEKVKLMEQQVKLAEQQSATSLSTNNLSMQRLEREKTEVTNKLTETEGKLKAVESSLVKLNEEMTKLKEAKSRLEGEKSKNEEENTKNKRMITAAKGKLVQNKSEIEKLKKELENSKTAAKAGVEQEQRLKAIQSQLERQQNELESTRIAQVELDSLKQEHENMKKLNNELHQRVSQLQKLLEVYQRQIQSPPGSQSQLGTEPPKTANIRPMTAPTSSPQVRMAQATPIQQVRSSTVAETRAMASIRPMAVSPATSSTQSVAPSPSGAGQTPTATVHPTTQEGAEGIMSPLQVSTTGQVRPTQSVQPVSPHVDDIVISVSETPGSQVEEPTSIAPTSSTTSIPQSSSVSSTVTSTLSTTTASVPPTAQTVHQESVATTSSAASGAAAVIAPSSSSVFTGKRQREEDVTEDGERSVSDPEGPMKKTKTLSSDTVAEDSDASTSQDWQRATAGREVHVALVGPEPVVEQAESQDTQIPGLPDQNVELPEYPETEEDEPHEDAPQHPTQSAPTQESVDDVIVLDGESLQPVESIETPSDSEETQAAEMERDETEYMDPEVIPDTEVDFEPDYQADEGAMEEPEPYEEEADMEGAEDNSQDDDCVVIDDDDEETEADVQMGEATTQGASQGIETQISSSSVGSSGLSSQSSDPSRLAPPHQIARLPSSGGRTQLQPFTFSGDGNVELGDDGIVPSTPTLFVPRRSDGFAEAVSSPLVSRQFVFGGQSDSSGPDFGQLASEGLDAPYIDFSQFEGGTPRSPQPPQSGTIIQITPPSPQATAVQGGVQQSVVRTVQQAIAVHVLGEESGASHSSEVSVDVIDSTAVTQEAAQSSQVHSTKPTLLESPPSEPISHVQPNKPVLIEATSSEGGHGEETPSTSTGASSADAGKPKIEPIVWDKPSTATTPSRASSSQSSASAVPDPSPIATVTHGVAKFTPAQQRTFRGRGTPQNRPQTAFRSRPSGQRAGMRGGHNVQGGNMQQIGQRGNRGGRFINRGTGRGQFRGGHQQPF